MKPQKILLTVLPFLFPGTSDDYWLRRANDGRLGPITAAPGKVRYRAVDSAEIERRFGPISDEKLSDAVTSYAASLAEIA